MFRFIRAGTAGVVLGAVLGAMLATAAAHVTLERPEASVGSSYKAVLRVPHGCGVSATTAIRVRIPAGLIAVKPMPKPGWQLATVTGKYPQPYTLRGVPTTEGVTEVAWSGGRLPDSHYDEFVFIGVLADELTAGQVLHLPVVQECEKGIHRWIDVKAAGGDGHGADSAEPAPALRLLPKR